MNGVAIAAAQGGSAFASRENAKKRTTPATRRAAMVSMTEAHRL